jgi:serine protease Do
MTAQTHLRNSMTHPPSHAQAAVVNSAAQSWHMIGALGGLCIALLVAALLAIASAPARAQSAPPQTFADLVDNVGDAVVNITTSSLVATRQGPRPTVPEGSPLEDFFNDFFDNAPGQNQPRRRQALGSGFVISQDGFIVTNNHVIEDADEIVIEFRSGLELDAELIGTDPTTDIALLRVRADQPLPFVRFGDSEAARVGDWVMAMGNPLGQGFSVSVGIISAKGRALSGSYDDYIQTDAAINQGNSGGPLFNMNGDVIGVNTAILSPTGGSIGIGFAMSSAVVTDVVDQLRDFGETRRGWLGVVIQDLDDDLAAGLGLGSTAGALVNDVPPGPASDAGILTGDVILTFDGTPIEDTRQLVRIVGESAVGDRVSVGVFRDGARRDLMVTLGRRETSQPAARDNGQTAPAAPSNAEILGLDVTPLTNELRQRLNAQNLQSGLAIQAVDPNSDAAQKGILPGDIIVEAAQISVTSIQDLTDQIAAARAAGQRSILFLIHRGGSPRFVALSLQ